MGEQPKCGTCRFWHCVPAHYMNGSNFESGECRIAPPARGQAKGWPSTNRTDWCGAYQSAAEAAKEPPHA